MSVDPSTDFRDLYTKFIMADGSGKPRYENMETRRLRVATQINMATPGENMFTAPVSLTETDIPGASSHGRKPAEMKKADLLFWLRCRGDSCKGMKTNPLNQNLIFLRLKSRRCTKGCRNILAN